MEDKRNWRMYDANYQDSELVLGLVGAVGTDLESVANDLECELNAYEYKVNGVRVSREIISELVEISGIDEKNQYSRINAYMDAGNTAREDSNENSILALGVAAKILARRLVESQIGNPEPLPRQAFIVNSLKHPSEVGKLREVYGEGFYLIGVYSDEESRKKHLKQQLHVESDSEVSNLMTRDEDERTPSGQRTRDTFHMADFFLHAEDSQERRRNRIRRFLRIIFGQPYETPTFDEFAMFMAFTSALRSADLSRQVGATVARNNEILAMGANDCPTSGGGLYWPYFDSEKNDIVDQEAGRDYKRKIDPNKFEQQKISAELEEKIAKLSPNLDKNALHEIISSSRIGDLTEFGRVVHAEMEALLSCARNNISCRGADLYCTTFPCHNCAKHLIAAGIDRVVYVEPYPKSKAPEFHDDSIDLDFRSEKNKGKVCFEPFMGVGPRRFFDLFSMQLGSGARCKRKDPEGNILTIAQKDGKLKLQMVPWTYIDKEARAAEAFKPHIREIDDAE